MSKFVVIFQSFPQPFHLINVQVLLAPPLKYIWVAPLLSASVTVFQAISIQKVFPLPHD